MAFNSVTDTGYFPMNLSEQQNLSGLDRAKAAGVNIDGSFLEGYLSMQQSKRADRADDRQERVVGMAEEKHGWARTAQEKEQFLQEGMLQASQEGGYEAVIDFLKQADPERALSFTKAKLELDRDMMKTDVMAAQSSTEIGKAMAEGYGILGNMGMAIAQAEPALQGDLYKQMLPIVKKVNPEAPDSYGPDAANMMLLAAAQATPINNLYSANKQMGTTHTQLGKIEADLQSRFEAGATPEDPTVRALLGERQKLIDQQQLAAQKLTQAELQTETAGLKEEDAKFKATNIMNKNIQQASQTFMKFADEVSTIESQFKLLAKDPNNEKAQAMLYRTIAKSANGGGVMTDLDVADFAETSNLWRTAYKKALALRPDGGGVKLTPFDISQLQDLFGAVKEARVSKQQQIENQFVGMSQQFPNLIDQNNLILPSRFAQGVQQQQSADQQGVLDGTTTRKAPDWALQALQQNPDKLQDFIAYYGYDPTQQQSQEGGM